MKLLKLILYFLFIFYLIIFSFEKKLKIYSSLSEIIITLNGTGNQQFINKIYSPYQIYINDELQKYSGYTVSNLTKQINKIKIIYKNNLNNCTSMFSGLTNIISIDLSNFNSSELTKIDYMFNGNSSLESINFGNFNTSKMEIMEYVFQNCYSLTSLNLSSFDTSKVTDFHYMFHNCTSLKELDLSNFNTSSCICTLHMFDGFTSLISLNLDSFDTSQVTYMYNMFQNCESLISLNLKHFNDSSLKKYENMFSGCNKNTIFCINETQNLIFLSLIKSNFKINCSDSCFIKNHKIIPEKNSCIESCFIDSEYIYEYNNICYNYCPNDLCISYLDTLVTLPIDDLYTDIISKFNFTDYYDDKKNLKIKCKNLSYFDISINDYLCVEECPKEYSYLKYNEICSVNCDIKEILENQCKILYNNNENKYNDDIEQKIGNGITDGSLDSLLETILDGENDFVLETNEVIYQIITTNNKNNNQYRNVSLISLGKCEDVLRDHYNINENIPLIIFKSDIYKEGLQAPLVKYEVYNSENKELLNINLCNETTINILLPAKLEEKNIFKYNLSDEYYNDECYVYTSDNGTDITLVDRKNEYINNNMSLCENECEYKGYNISTEKAECECKPKSIMSLVSEILANKDILFENIPDIKNSTNFKIIKCYKLVFSKEGLITNIGSYIILTMILINLVCLFIFIFKGNKN